MPSRLAGRRLYISDLTRRQAAMERGEEPMNPAGYRLVARRLRSALAGQAPALLRTGFCELPLALLPVLTEALDNRHFDELGQLHGPAALLACAQAEALWTRLRLPRPTP